MYVASAGGGSDGIYGDTSTNGSQNSTSVWVGVNSTPQWNFQEDGGGAYSFQTAATTNTWTHLALTYDGTNTFKAYINGSLVNTNTGTLTPSRNPFQYFDTGFGGDVHTQDCCVFSAALTQVEIQALMTTSCPATQLSNLFLWWPEITGNQGFDYSGNRNSWTSDGSAAETTFPPVILFDGTVRRIWQPPSSGGVTVAGAMANGSALAGAAVQQQPVSGALADSSALAGRASALVLSALADSSALSGAAIQTQVLAGSLSDGSALSASVRVLVSGALANNSALVGAAVQQQPVAGALANGSALSGSANTNLNVSGAMANGSALAGAAVQQQPVAGSLASSSSLSGTAVQQQPVAGAMATSSHLTGDTSATLSAAGSLANSSALAGAAVQQNRAAGALANGSALSGSAVALASGALATSSRLLGGSISLVTSAAASGSALAGTAVQLNLAQGAMATSSRMVGAATGGSAVVPFVPAGWLPDLPISGSPHGAWTSEPIFGTPEAHSGWAA
jgi:concanavalin A-like lectin/glucanase superfamily protein